MTPSLASSKIVHSVDDAFLWIGGISLVLLVGITAAMLYFVWRYRRSKHPQAAEIHGNMKLEITWIVIPVFIVLFMFWKGYEGFALMRDVPEDAMVVEVEARQWAWTFRYPGEGISVPELYVPAGKPVKLLLTSPVDDVLHSFYLPDFRVKEDCVPGRQGYLWFQADRPGIHNIFCAEFCGKDHSRMLSKLHVLAPKDYEAWLDARIADRYKPVEIEAVMDRDSADLKARGAETLYQTYCISSHGAEGQGGLVEGARNFQSLKDWKQGVKVTDMFKTLTIGVSGTQMRAFNNLSAWDRFALAWYVTHFYKGGDRPESTRADFEQLIKDYKLDQQPVIRREFPIRTTMEQMAEEAQKQGTGGR
jgi:cytochrome c oxidase subunit II